MMSPIEPAALLNICCVVLVCAYWLCVLIVIRFKRVARTSGYSLGGVYIECFELRKRDRTRLHISRRVVLYRRGIQAQFC
jgi:hypothetical protein